MRPLSSAAGTTSGRFVRVGDQDLEVQEYPATRAGRPPLVFLHEGMGCIATWRTWPAEVAAATGCRVVVWSRAGYGASTPYASPRTMRYLHHEGEVALPAFLDAMGLADGDRKPVLVGHSDGGSISLVFAGAHPAALSGAVVIAPHSFVEPVTIAGLRAAREKWDASPNWRAALAKYHARPDAVFYDWNNTWLQAEFILHWNIEEYLPRIQVPVLAIQAVDDEFATLRQIACVEDQVPGGRGRMLALQRGGHQPHRDEVAAPAMKQAIAAFVARLEAPAPTATAAATPRRMS